MHADLSKTSSSPGDITPPRLNILALPSFTAILFGLMAFVILAAVFSSMLPNSSFWWPPLVLGVVLLTPRDFLRGPQREEQRSKLQPDDQEMASLQNALAELSQQAGTYSPQLLAASQRRIWSFGTFRRRFVAVGERLGPSLSKYVVNSESRSGAAARAVLAHELAHFTNGDIQLAGLARSLLKVTFLVALTLLWIIIGLISLMARIGPEVTSPEFWVALTQQLGLPGVDLAPLREMLRAMDPTVFDLLAAPGESSIWWFSMNYYTAALLPFIVSTAILYLFLWRKLMRVREFYADGRAAEIMTKPDSDGVVAILDAMDLMGTLGALDVTSASPVRRSLGNARLRGQSLFGAGLLAFRPEDDLLKQALVNPLLAFGRPWQMAVWAGVAVLLLELMLRGSLTASYINQPGPHLPLVTASVVFSLWLLPQVCSGLGGRRLVGMVVQMALIYTAVKLSLNFLDAMLVGAAYLAGQLGPLGRIVDLWACTMVGGCGEVTPVFVGVEFPWSQIVRWHILTPIAYFTIFALPTLVVFLLLDARLKRWALTWYRLQASVRRVFWASLVTLLALVLLIVVPVGNRLFFPWIYDRWPPAVLVGMALGVLIAVAAAANFTAAHRRLAGHCWQCDQTIPGPFALGTTCPHCHTVQHPWLLASYGRGRS